MNKLNATSVEHDTDRDADLGVEARDVLAASPITVSEVELRQEFNIGCTTPF